MINYNRSIDLKCDLAVSLSQFQRKMGSPKGSMFPNTKSKGCVSGLNSKGHFVFVMDYVVFQKVFVGMKIFMSNPKKQAGIIEGNNEFHRRVNEMKISWVVKQVNDKKYWS